MLECLHFVGILWGGSSDTLLSAPRQSEYMCADPYKSGLILFTFNNSRCVDINPLATLHDRLLPRGIAQERTQPAYLFPDHILGQRLQNICWDRLLSSRIHLLMLAKFVLWLPMLSILSLHSTADVSEPRQNPTISKPQGGRIEEWVGAHVGLY